MLWIIFSLLHRLIDSLHKTSIYHQEPGVFILSCLSTFFLRPMTLCANYGSNFFLSRCKQSAQGSICEHNSEHLKNWVQWVDIILLTLQPSIIKRSFKSVKALTIYFQHTMNNSLGSSFYLPQYDGRVKYHYSNICLFHNIRVKTNLERDMRIWDKWKILGAFRGIIYGLYCELNRESRPQTQHVFFHILWNTKKIWK